MAGPKPNPTRNAEQQARVLELMARGKTYREIGKAVGISATRAWRVGQEGLARSLRLSVADDLRRLENLRLDMLTDHAATILATPHLLVQGGKVIHHTGDDGVSRPLHDDGPNLRAIETLLRIMERRARLNGLDAPQVFRLTLDAIDQQIAEAEAELQAEEARVRIAIAADHGGGPPPASPPAPPTPNGDQPAP